MEINSDQRIDIIDLAWRLKEERLFVQSEKQLLQALHSEGSDLSDQLFRTAWITRQQRGTLHDLILSSVANPPNICCYRANAFEVVGFIDGYKQLAHYDIFYGDFLAHLRDNPSTVALCLVLGEKSSLEDTRMTVFRLISSVYGNCIIPSDEHRTLLLLQSLMQRQLADSDDPRRLLRKGQCSFCAAFKHFSESLFSSKLYLTAALHDSVMSVLMDDECSLETNPQKVMDQFTPEEKLLKFGPPDSAGYQSKINAHIQSSMDHLVLLCNKFIDGLCSNLYCFPQSLDWIISELHKILIKSGKASVGEVRATCADLLFTWFICPAIVDPEPFGIISDILVSENARFNLMQVATILQQLAHQTGSDASKSDDILSKFPKDCMTSFLDTFIDNMKLSDCPPTPVSHLRGLTRNSALITEMDLQHLVSYFRGVISTHPGETELKPLEGVLSSIPVLPTSQSNQKTPTTPKTPLSPMQNGITSQRASVTSPLSIKESMAGKFNAVTKKSKKSSQSLAESDDAGYDGSMVEPEDVLVVPLGNQTAECPGLLPEPKVLATLATKIKARPEVDPGLPRTGLASISEMPEKQLRFSADASGNSDNMMEAMSIGASNSVYSMDLETENVSNLSGRNTPRSAISMASSTTENLRPEIIDSTQLPNNTNITDQFGKFDINKEMDKDRGNIETWSTDVIGSDTSEPPSEANPIEHLKEIAEDEDPSLVGAASSIGPHVSDIPETASETWSVDVIQSDSEMADDRLQDILQDDEDASQQDLDMSMQAEGGLGEVEPLPSKGADNQFSRRSSSSVDRSSSNEMEELSKRETPGDEGDHLSIKPFQFLSFDQRSNFEPSSSVLEVPPPLPARPHKLPPALPPRTKQPQNDLNMFSMHNGSHFRSFDSRRSGYSTNSDNILLDFDPLATNSQTMSANPFADSIAGGFTTVKRNNLPPGAKPKERVYKDLNAVSADSNTPPPLLLPSKSSSFNPLYQMHHDRSEFDPFAPHSSQEPNNSSNARLSHFNHGYFDPSMDINQTLAPPVGFASTESKTNSDSGVGSDGAALFPPSHLFPPPDLFPPPPSEDVQSKEFAIRSSTSGESLDVPNDMMRSISSETYESSGSYGDRLEVNDPGDKGKSWFKKKFKQINKIARSKTSKGHSTSPEYNLQVPEKSESDYSKKTEEVQIISNPALVMDHFVGDEVKSSSVPASSSEDILNKYRGLRRAQSSEGLDGVDSALPDSSADETSSHSDKPDSSSAEQNSSDPENSSVDAAVFAYNDAKRKLRIVLRSADIGSFSRFTDVGLQSSDSKTEEYPRDELLSFLKALLAEAMNLQDRSLIAQLRETLRCIQNFNNEGCKKLLESLKEDHENRAPYIAYLIRSRKGLLATKAHLNRLLERIQRDKEVVNKFFTMVCVRLFLERQESSIQNFIQDFKELTAADEKTHLVKRFLGTLNVWIQQDPIWNAASETQKVDAEVATERAVMSRIYKMALYPNGDGDIHRDQVLHDHIDRLSKVVTASHKSLQIHEKYRRESPWPAAQAEILNINVYKTPKDKIQCVVRCCLIIMNLLSMANDNAAPPGADDFTPVLMFVLIKANPPSLLSTVQYVNSFYFSEDSYSSRDDSSRAEEQYWWMQFSAAIEFLKTIDDRQ